jgi:hypothetical protein
VEFDFAAAIYGLIAVSTLLAAESATRETFGDTVAGVALALVLYWLAHGYARLVSFRVREGGRLTPAELARNMGRSLPVLAGAVLPLLAVLIAWAAGARLNTATNAALWTAVAAIVSIEVAAGIRAELSGRELVIQTAVGAALGLLVLALRLALR